MKLISAIIIASFLASTAGCLGGLIGASGAPPSSPAQLDSTPNTADAWRKLEAKAGKLAAWSEKIKTDQPVRLRRRGFAAEHRFSAEAGRCYNFGVAWSYQGKAQLAVMFPKREDGARANTQMAGRTFRLPDIARPQVCADNDGPVKVTLSGITPAGFLAHNALLEYALVIGSRSESADEAATRREGEQVAVDNERQRQATNIAIARERERRQRARRCRDCSDAYRACQVSRHHQRRYPRRGVTVSASCELQFRRCSQGACGAPPR